MGNALGWDDTIKKEEHVVCFGFKREPCLYLQACVFCRIAAIHIFINYTKLASRAYNVPSQAGLILSRY